MSRQRKTSFSHSRKLLLCAFVWNLFVCEIELEKEEFSCGRGGKKTEKTEADSCLWAEAGDIFWFTSWKVHTINFSGNSGTAWRNLMCLMSSAKNNFFLKNTNLAKVHDKHQ
jgi:hypothetical protein